jgi:3-oxoacyl-[acyl-carrier protein] reductase
MIDTGLKNRVILVTGANHGIGAATARAFAAQGAKVFIQYLRLSTKTTISTEKSVPGEALYRANQAQTAYEVMQLIRAQGGQVDALEIDFATPTNIPALFDRVEKAFGPVDVLVNNAAFCQADSFIPQEQRTSEDRSAGGFSLHTITAQAHNEHFAINSRATALMIAEFADRYLQRGASWGRIINVSTDGAYCFPGAISYGASKLAMESYSRSAAVELGKYGITVNVVSPGPIQTGYITSELERKAITDIPLGRIGQPEDVADVIVFLASEQARWLTGQRLYAGGGHAM